ncbi:CDC50/LEM3 family [Schizophyllum amplum]|uniref:CDC50/LEM3 family n=1 Tax=Schizophyllum amplum TaxID=97359 RepID=A0A550C3Q3_9AGAR|nr:CDC50/LEM3 family [Auriculariopsis ampla]
MGLFNRKANPQDTTDANGEPKEKKTGWKRPANTAFKQQRLKAWQPILTPKTVLPTLFIIAIAFAPIGGLLIWGSSKVSEMTFDYSECENLSASASNDSLTFSDMPSNKYKYALGGDAAHANPSRPRYAYLDNSQDDGFTDIFNQKQCIIEFNVPASIGPSVMLYYKLSNFYQNHRRYVNSLNSDQLLGKRQSASDLDDGDCDPLGSRDSLPIYPCGLIANSIFNDTFYSPVLQNPPEDTESTTYEFTSKGIAWPGEAKKYVSSPIGGDGYSSVSDIVPPPNWMLQYPDGYTDDNPPPDLKNDEHFQNWMRTAGLPTFSKLYGRNDNDKMIAGTYRMVIGLNFPVLPYKGTKSIVITTVSWIGGKNPFLGWAYVAAAGLFCFLAIAGTARHLIRPRRLGDMSLLSWNR